jgi:polysaccharide export outer membrane protein
MKRSVPKSEEATVMRALPLGISLLVLSFLPSWTAAAAAQTPSPSQAQQLIEQRTGQQVSQEQILEQLQSSGLSRSQVRNRLLGMGLDPSLADPYFDRLEGRSTGQLPNPDETFVGALSRMGLLESTAIGGGGVGGAGVGALGRTVADSLGLAGALGPRPDSLSAEGELPIFGKATFARRTSQFRPLLTGPAPPDYTLGPGDEISLVLTGDVALAYLLPVSREGTIVIPDVGQVIVNGLNLAQLEDRLYDRLGAVYSGVRRGADATTRFQLSLGRLRTNEVFVIGEVEYPGSYEVPGLSTALGALYQAGGPTEEGSFRRVQVRRGGTVVGEVDLYDYLLTGDASADLRLENGDVVFVPLAGPRVRVEGEVPRNAIYEVAEDETLEDVLGFAGRGSPNADLARIRIDRILPVPERTEGRERVLLDVDLPDVSASNGVIPLRDGDEIRVPPIGEEQRDRVVLTGAVFNPGPFELASGMTVWDLIRRGGGLRPEAFQPVAHITRLNPVDSTYVLRRISLRRTPDGRPVEDLRLEDQDSVRVFAQSTLITPRSVRVEGEVKEPGEFVLADGMTVEDLILAAGGFTERAQGLSVEVARLEPGLVRQNQVARVYAVSMEGTLPWSVLGRTFDDVAAAGGGVGGTSDDGSGNADPGEPTLGNASEVTLMEGDRVIVRPLPGYVEEATVEVTGQVQYPGAYALLQREERVSDLVQRAGGFTPDAYVDGAHLVRDSTLVGIDLAEIVEDPGSDADVVLRPNDVLNVPLYDGTVLVRGAVASESRVIYDSSLGFDDYVERAGGALAEADLDRANVLYANGERAVVHSVLWFFTDHPDVGPGSTITVPYAREGQPTDWSAIVTQGLGILGSVITIAVALTR